MGQMHHISEGDMVLLTALLDGALDPQQSDALRQRLADDDTLHDAYLDLV
jgi:anti-sigma factor RsiW